MLAASITLLSPASAQMDRLERTYRPIVILAESANTPVLNDLNIVLRQSRNALADRDVMVITVAGPEASAWDPVLNETSDLSFDAEELRAVYGGQAEPVSLVLVGKDGDIKDRGTTSGDIQRFLDLIDTMPMRQREIEAREREMERREEIENRMWGGETFGR